MDPVVVNGGSPGLTGNLLKENAGRIRADHRAWLVRLNGHRRRRLAAHGNGGQKNYG